MKKIKNGTIKKALKFIGKYKYLLFLAVLFAAVSASLMLYVPILVGSAIDFIVAKDNVDFESIFAILLKVGVIVGSAALLQWLMNTVNNRITYHVVRDIRNEAFKKIEKLPLKYIDSHSYGDIVSRVITDVDTFADGLLMGFTNLFTGVVTILGTLVFMLTINVKITLVVVLLTPVSMLVAKFITSRTYSMFTKQSETRGEQTAFIDEMIGNQKVVSAFAHEDENLEKFDDINNRLEKYSLKATFYSSLTNPGTRFVNGLVYAGVSLTGAFSAIGAAPAITVGGLVSFLSYANQYAKPFNEISGIITELNNALACADRVFELIEQPSETPDYENAAVLSNVKGDITLKEVKFSYSPDQKLIENLNLNAKSGMRVAIVGPTGCGKTTLINLLMRFYDVTGGSVSVDGNDIRNVTRDSLRKNFGMVLQETWLDEGTVRDNIAFGNPDASLDEVVAAAKAAHAHS
ncbi:MAG: ABC transporter ATP-binding protein, partial [Clostridia bacterium]|nr:ABC transporter ATP-binding protein [Clostridia bacterium]